MDARNGALGEGGIASLRSAWRGVVGSIIGALVVAACSGTGNDASSDAGSSAPPAAALTPATSPAVDDAATPTPTTALATTALAPAPTTAPIATAEPTTSATPVPSTLPAREVPPGPSADVGEALTGGNGVFIGSGAGEIEADFVEEEFVAAGAASAYRAIGELGGDGRWTLEPDVTADYRTRVLVRRPADPDAVSGVVVVEWLNVSGGVDANPDYSTLHEEITRRGHVWVGVSAQLIGVEGGPVAVRVDSPGVDDVVGKGLKGIDPDRYGSLAHPGDAFAYDIFTQVGRAIRAGGAVLGGLTPGRVLAAGESQSAFALTTYINGVHPLARVYDGYFVHSRGSVGLPLGTAGAGADIAGSLAGAPTILRDDTDVPVFVVQSEGDTVGIFSSSKVRQPDTDLFRLWEVAGTAHADAHLLGATAAAMDCGLPINDGPFHIVAKAAFHHLVAWVESGVTPPIGPRLDVDETGTLRRDADGIALGGVRSPAVDVPVQVLSSVAGPNGSIICMLLGSTSPMPPARLGELYPSSADYEQRYIDVWEQTVAAGFALPDDEGAALDYMHPELLAG